MQIFIQTLMAGVLLGGVYALVSVGLNLIFGVVRIINFAHGELVMVAMYMTFWMWQLWGFDPYVSFFIVAPVMFLVGLALQRFIIQPIQGSSSAMKIFVTIGVSIVLQLSLIHISEPTRLGMISYAVF